MGERNWYRRYHDARAYADEQAEAYERGETIQNWRQVSEQGTDQRRELLTGAAWVAWAYQIAAENATSLVHARGKQWQYLVDECGRLTQAYQEKASHE
jgi:hypothetical protein